MSPIRMRGLREIWLGKAPGVGQNREFGHAQRGVARLIPPKGSFLQTEQASPGTSTEPGKGE